MTAREGTTRERERSGAAGRSLVALVAVVLAAVLGVRLLGGDGPANGPAIGPGDAPAERADAPDEATVLEVTDGDTLVLDIGGTEERVRLIGIDTPESVARDEPVECFGKEASQRLGELVPVGTVVRLERDIEPRDRYDRLLVYVYRASDGLFVNHDQVAQGFAEAIEYAPNITRSDELEVAESSARATNIGLWAACGGTDVPATTP